MFLRMRLTIGLTFICSQEGKRDPLRFNVEAEEKSYKMRAHSAAEAERCAELAIWNTILMFILFVLSLRWITGLNDWKEFFLMNM